jgi:hypothetical protein
VVDKEESGLKNVEKGKTVHLLLRAIQMKNCSA